MIKYPHNTPICPWAIPQQTVKQATEKMLETLTGDVDNASDVSLQTPLEVLCSKNSLKEANQRNNPQTTLMTPEYPLKLCLRG